MHACVWGVYIYIYIYIGCLFNSQFSPASMLHGTSLPAVSWVSLSLTHTHTLTRSLFLARARALSGLLPPALAADGAERHYKSGVGCSEYSALAIIPASCVSSVPLPHFKHPLSLARALSLSLARSLSDMHYSLSICDNITPLSPLPSLPPPPPV